MVEMSNLWKEIYYDGQIPFNEEKAVMDKAESFIRQIGL